ncbi:MAG: 50S ribosomal protein L5 [Deltaproteobacteria bacterium]|nr:50S ribosomal protein L5 [Deltaproteobacteria bacterium]
MTKIQEKYQKEVAPVLMKEFGYTNVMQVPRISKITVNMGVGEAVSNPKVMEAALRDLTAITGQKPLVTKAKKAISTFKLRVGMEIGAMTTLRRDMMWNFLERLITIGLPRVRDFRGIPRKSFDGHGNYSMGLKEQIIFPEVNYEEIDKIRGMNITINTTAKSDQEAFRLLELMGMPFRKA